MDYNIFITQRERAKMNEVTIDVKPYFGGSNVAKTLG